MKPSSALLAAIVAATFAASLSACGGTTYIGDFGDGSHLMYRNGVVTTHVRGEPDATIDLAGDLRIDGKSVAITPAQRALLRVYFSQVVNIRKAGIETGKAGASMALHAIGAVASGLAHGDPDSIEPRIDARAKDIEAKALAICTSLDALQKTQDAVVAGVPAFRRYGAITVRGSSDCESHVTIRR